MTAPCGRSVGDAGNHTDSRCGSVVIAASTTHTGSECRDCLDCLSNGEGASPRTIYHCDVAISSLGENGLSRGVARINTPVVLWCL